MSSIEQRTAPEQRTIDVDVQDIDTRGRTVVGYAAVYNVLSHDLGGFKERIAPGAFAGVLNSDVRALFNHDPNEVLGRTKSGTLRLFDEQRGLRFELDLPASPLGDNVRTAIARGDIDGASFRFTVDGESWNGDVRTINTVKELHDVTVATFAAYPAASVELRTRPRQEDTVMEQPEPDTPDEPDKPAPDTEPAPAEQRSRGRLHVADINHGQGETRSLLGQFKHAGWRPGARAEIAWREFEQAAESRAITWSGSIDHINALRRDAAGFGANRLYAFPVFQTIGVDSATTSVDVLSQSARTLPSPASTVRALDAVTTKPEVANTIAVSTLALKQVAAVESGVPNIHLEQAAITSIIGVDLRLAISEGLDSLVLTAIAASGFQAPGTDPMLISVRKAMTTIMAAGYSPNVLILTPAAAEALDTLRTSGPELMYVFGATNLAPSTVYGLEVRISKTIPAPAVVDSVAFGKMYASPVSLQTFEENAGATNSSLVRMELSAVFGTERQAAAVRIAAS